MSELFQYLNEHGAYSQLLVNPKILLMHLLDLAILFIAVIILFFITTGWGLILRKLSGFKSINGYNPVDSWLGVLSISIFIELINFWLPISWHISCVILIIGLLGIVLLSNRPILKFNYSKKILLTTTGILLILCFIFGSKALYMPPSSDSLLYHLNTIRWLNEYPTIPGLGNLHGRLAFNQSYFSFLSFLNIYPYSNHAPSIGNVFFIFLALASSLEILKLNIPMREILFLGIFFSIVKNADMLHSTNTDLTNSLLQVIVFIQLIKIFNFFKYEYELIEFICITLYLCLLIILFKLSSAAYALTVVTVLLFCFINILIKNLQFFFVTVAICIGMLFTHCIRGYLLSGTPFYPSTFFSIQSLPWSMSIESIRGEANWAFSWARAPGLSPDEVLGNWKWLNSWVTTIPRTFIIMMLAGMIFYFASFFTAIDATYRKQFQPIYIPLLGSMIFWFFSAPAFRFIGSAPELFATLSIYIFCCTKIIVHSAYLNSSKSRNFLLSILVCLMAIKYTGIKKLSFEGWMNLEPRPLTIRETNSGLKVFTPQLNDSYCGDSPLPCTPYFDENLRYIGNVITSGLTKK